MADLSVAAKALPSSMAPESTTTSYFSRSSRVVEAPLPDTSRSVTVTPLNSTLPSGSSRARTMSPDASYPPEYLES